MFSKFAVLCIALAKEITNDYLIISAGMFFMFVPKNKKPKAKN